MNSSRKYLTLGVLLISTVWLMPAWGHHSHGNYRMTEYTHLTGTVTEVHWMNPHAWLYVAVPDEDGKNTIWAMEGGGVSALTRRGWSKDSIKVGDEISVRCHQLRDNTNGCLLGFVTPPNGEEMMWD